jgi:hypothetical protein
LAHPIVESLDDGALDSFDTEQRDRSDAAAEAVADSLIPLLQKLPACVNKVLVDKLAEEFCYLNNSGNRRRLVEVRKAFGAQAPCAFRQRQAGEALGHGCRSSFMCLELVWTSCRFMPGWWPPLRPACPTLRSSWYAGDGGNKC